MTHALRAEVELDIHAPIDRVWRTIVRLDEYAQWNPFTPEVRDVRVDEDPRVDDVFIFVVHFDNGRKFISPERVLAIDPPHTDADGVTRATFTYRFDHWLHAVHLVRATRTTTLEQRNGAPGAPTRFHTFEDMRGLLARFTPIDGVREGFAAQARALKARCET